MEQRTYLIFTDGACLGNPGPGGWAAIIANPSGKVKEIGGGEAAVTNNRMELKAPIEALRLVAKDKPAPVKIYTDSQYVIRGITEWIFGWEKRGFITQEGKPVLHEDLWRELRSLTQDLRVDWIHIKGHASYHGNERCDQISVNFAKGKLTSLFEGPREKYSIDLSDVPSGAQIEPSGDPYYLSVIDGQIFRDKEWPSCEARVKGRKGVKFKKVRDSLEEARTLKLWGI